MRIGILGFGHMGCALSLRLMDKGIKIIAWNRTKSKFKGINITIAENPSFVVSNSDIILISLFDSESVNNVMLMTNGILSTNLKGKIFVDTTTNHYSSVVEFHNTFLSLDANYIEAPILGSVIPTSNGNLTILVSGDEKIFKNITPILNLLASNLFYIGIPGLSTKIKLINNFVLGSFMVALAESIIIAQEKGISRQLMLDILSVGAGNSMLLNAKRENLLKNDYSAHFATNTLFKDLLYFEELITENNSNIYKVLPTREFYSLAIQHGLGQEDFSSIIKIFQK